MLRAAPMKMDIQEFEIHNKIEPKISTNRAQQYLKIK
jgi:hypothetical protein